jgi:DNA-binding NarL/FixJ family response regulator
MKALLVDDERFVRESLAMAMRAVNPSAQITDCGTIDQARELMGNTQYDFLFLDIELKGARRGGLEYLKELKAKDDQTRVIMVSTEDKHDIVLDAIQSGAAGFLSKNDSGISSYMDAVEIIMKDGIYLPKLDWSSGSAIPYSQIGIDEPTVITTVDAKTLNVTDAQYECLYYLSKGNQYKTIARIRDKEPGTIEKTMSAAFARMNVTDQLQFMVMLNENGWRLELEK